MYSLLMYPSAQRSQKSLPICLFLKSARSLPAVKLSPSPWNRTTRTAGFFSARFKPSDIALYIALLRAFFLSARASVKVMMPASISVFTCSVMIVLLAGSVRSPDIGCDRRFSSRGLTAESLPSGFKNFVGQLLVAGRTRECDRAHHGGKRGD